MDKKSRPHYILVATALETRVLPVPGGPYDFEDDDGPVQKEASTKAQKMVLKMAS
jgi:hypothetical protein